MTRGVPLLPIQTERLGLREFALIDLGAMHAYASREDVTQYLMWGPNDQRASEGQLMTFVEVQSHIPRLIYELALTLRGDDRTFGALCLYLDERGLEAELGFVLHPDFWGQGLATEAAAALMAWGFDRLNLERIWATCDTRNEASVRVLEKIGMVREATLRGTRETADGLVDQYQYGLTAFLPA